MKSSTLLLIAGLGVAGFGAVSAQAQPAAAPAAAAPAAPASGPAGDVAHGKKVYMDLGCADCHGTVGQGGGNAGPKLTPNPMPFAAFSHQLRAPRGRMPIYTPTITPDQDVADMYAYVRSIPKPRDYKDIPLLNK